MEIISRVFFIFGLMKKVLYLLVALFSFSLGYSAVFDTVCKEEKKIENVKPYSYEVVIADNVNFFALKEFEGSIDVPLPKVQSKNIITYFYFRNCFKTKKFVRQVDRDIVPRIKI